MQLLEDLMTAAKNGDIAVAKQLLDHHPELLEARRETGESPLIAALYHGKIAVVQELLDRGVPLSLHEAAAVGDEEYIAYLLDTFEMDMQDYSFDGWTPLHLAGFFGARDAAERLIDRGADLHALSRNSMANQPIHAAASGRKNEVVRLLLEKGADPNAKQSGGWTPLHSAVQQYNSELVHILLEFGARADIPNEEGTTPGALAASRGYNDLAELLGAGGVESQ